MVGYSETSVTTAVQKIDESFTQLLHEIFIPGTKVSRRSSVTVP